MITKGDKIVFASIAVLTILIIAFREDIKSLFTGKKEAVKVNTEKDKKDKKKDKKDSKINDAANHSEIKIDQKWDLPSDLKEISGIAYIGDNRFACVQDEAGKIFVFNTNNNRVEKEIPFAGNGDYEGIAIVGSTAYVLRADGKLFEVIEYDGNKPSVIQHSTHLTAKQDVEGLCYDKKNNRLLLAIKGKEQNSNDYKGIYAFDLSLKKLGTAPVHKVELMQNTSNQVNKKNNMKPSDLDIHPATGDVYIIDGASPKLLVMNADGTQKNFYELNTSHFPQPEGLAFAETGELFISNEGRTGLGNILKVSVSERPKS